MKEALNHNIPNYKKSLTIPEHGLVGVLLKSTEMDYMKDSDALPISDDLPPDHLTATFWG